MQMFELPFVFIAGFLGSAHCVGMCGPFALALGSGAPNWSANLKRQTIYSLGRIFTYTVIGAFGGYGGLRLAQVASDANIPAILSVFAGSLLLYEGASASGLFGRRRAGGPVPCLSATFFGSFVNRRQPGATFLAGLFTGMLPCGLVYAFAALAASSSSMWLGASTMAAFGLGTVPIMVLTGYGGTVLSLGARRRVLRVAAICVMIAGAVSLARGISHAGSSRPLDPSSCPMCE
jgi:hypothetical protein